MKKPGRTMATAVVWIAGLCVGSTQAWAAPRQALTTPRVDVGQRMREMKAEIVNQYGRGSGRDFVISEVEATREFDSAAKPYQLTVKPSSGCACVGGSALLYSLEVTSYKEVYDFGGGYKLTIEYFVGQVMKGSACLPGSVAFWIKVSGTGFSEIYSAAETVISDGDIGIAGSSYVDPKGSAFSGFFFGVVARAGSECWAADHQMTIAPR